MKDKFKEIFKGLEIAYGQTRMTEDFNELGKHKTKYSTIKNPPVDELWQAHLDGKDPALGIIPINENSECKWGCVDIDVYKGFNHLELLNKIKKLKIPAVVCRSKSGGAHVFLFTKEFVPASLMRAKLKKIASAVGFAKAEIFPKQDELKAHRGDTGSFLNLPYHGGDRTVRYAFNDNAEALTIENFFKKYDEVAFSKEDLKKFVFEDKDKNEDFDGIPPCLQRLLTDGVPNGMRNETMFNVGVYLKKRYTENDEWKDWMSKYNDKYIKPPLKYSELNTVISSVGDKEYNYGCNKAPLESFCDSLTCMTKKFGVGRDADTANLAINEIRRFCSDPPLFFVSVGEKTVEVDSATLMDCKLFNRACLEQIGTPVPLPGNALWVRQLIKLLKNAIEIPAPESLKIKTQLGELLAEYTNKATGKSFSCIRNFGLSYTEKGFSYFKRKEFWRFLKRSNVWDTKTFTQPKTYSKLKDLFEAEEIDLKIDGVTTSVVKIPAINLKPATITQTKLQKAPYA